MTNSTPKTSGTATSSAVRVSGSAKVRTNKHRAVKREYNGMTFDSGRELKRWQELELMQKAGEIIHLVRQVMFELAPPVVLGGRKKPAIRYVADFAYWTATGCPAFIVEDAKSPHMRNNPVFRIKMHLLKLEHGIEVILV
jgi:hypothetical protein